MHNRSSPLLKGRPRGILCWDKVVGEISRDKLRMMRGGRVGKDKNEVEVGNTCEITHNTIFHGNTPVLYFITAIKDEGVS